MEAAYIQLATDLAVQSDSACTYQFIKIKLLKLIAPCRDWPATSMEFRATLLLSTSLTEFPISILESAAEKQWELGWEAKPLKLEPRKQRKNCD
jgi:hypothetical protein